MDGSMSNGVSNADERLERAYLVMYSLVAHSDTSDG